MCPLVLELKKSEKLETLVCVTGQHREMLKQVLDIFKVVPDYDMAIMKKGQDLTDVTTAILTGMRAVSYTHLVSILSLFTIYAVSPDNKPNSARRSLLSPFVTGSTAR